MASRDIIPKFKGTQSNPKYRDTIPIYEAKSGYVPVFRVMSPNFGFVSPSSHSVKRT